MNRHSERHRHLSKTQARIDGLLTCGADPSQWVDEHGDYLYRYALLRVGNPQVAEDLVQETLLAALRSRDGFRGQASERSWHCGILKHKICDYFRTRSRETSFTDLGFLEDEMAYKFVGETAMSRSEFWAIFRQCLSKLPPRVADAFTMREVESMETAQICEVLAISQNNLWVILHRARMALRKCLEINWFEKRPGKCLLEDLTNGAEIFANRRSRVCLHG
jgi:RNA polymerase sigma-70 factor (ECF subfamily)